MSVPFSSPLRRLTGRVEIKQCDTRGIGRHHLVSGLSMSFGGKPYVVMSYLQAPNNEVPGGNPQELVLIWCPGVPEALSSTISSAVDILASLMPPGFHPNS